MTDQPEPGVPDVSGGGTDADTGDGIDGEGPLPKRRPFVYVRAFLVAMPLAILMGSIVSPPDGFAQLILIVGSLVGGYPIAVRLVAARRYGPKELGLFFGVVLVVTLVALWVLGAVGSGPVPEILARFAVVLLALYAADFVVFRS